MSAAAPFTLIAAAELRLAASLAAILNATTPLFAPLAAARLREPLTGRRPAGVLLGIGGVGVLVGPVLLLDGSRRPVQLRGLDRARGFAPSLR